MANNIVFISIIFYSYCVSLSLSQNILCEGDFKSFTLNSFNFQRQLAGFFDSNYSCWYNQNGQQIQIKDQLVNLSIGKCADLISTVPYVLCQNVLLMENENYQISFTLGNSQSINYSSVDAQISGIKIMDLNATGDFAIVSGKKIFRSFSNLSTLCFKTSSITRSNSQYSLKGPLVTNLSLMRYIEVQIYLDCLMDMDGQNYQNGINIKCDTSILQTVLRDALKSKIEVYIESQQQNKIQIQEIGSDQIKIQIIPLKGYKLYNITISVSETINYNFKYYRFRFKNNKYHATYVIQQQNQIKMVKIMSPLIEKMMDITHKVYITLRSSFVSYFMASIISFWNLSLLYNLLNISTVPLFLKYFYENLLYKFFTLTSVIKWLSEKVPDLSEKLDLSNTLGTEHMAEFRNNFGWFGYFGMSSQFLSNNLQQLLLLSILIIKLVALNYLRKLLCGCHILKVLLPKSLLEILSIFIKQLFMAIIFMVVSAGTDILSQSFIQYRQKINSILQYTILWISIIIYPLFFIISIKIKRKKSIKKDQIKKKQLQAKKQAKQKKKSKFYDQVKKHTRKSKKKLIISSFYTFLQLLLYLIIPFIVLFDSPTAFLIILSVIIWVRWCWYWKNHSILFISKRKKIFAFLNLLIWFIHHHIYLFFYCLQKINNFSGAIYQQSQRNMLQVIKISGYVSIFMVLLGGICQIINFIFLILAQILFIAKLIIKNIKKSRVRPEIQDKKIVQNKKQEVKKQKRVFITFLMNKKQKSNSQNVQKQQKNSPKKRAKIKLQSKLDKKEMLKIT